MANLTFPDKKMKTSKPEGTRAMLLMGKRKDKVKKTRNKKHDGEGAVSGHLKKDKPNGRSKKWITEGLR